MNGLSADMIGYSATEVFTPVEQNLLRCATSYVEMITDNDYRCHEITRAVGIVLDYLRVFENRPIVIVIDGTYGAVDHSWLVLRRPDRRVILDCYSVASLPIVQLVDPFGPMESLYHAKDDRDDIDEAIVDRIVTEIESKLGVPNV